MSGPNQQPGLLAAPFVAVGEELEKHQRATPTVKASNRGYLGTFLLSGAAYLAMADDVADYPKDLKIALAIAAGFGLLLLMTAWRTRSQREPLAAFFAIAVPFAGWLAVTNYAPELLNDLYVRCFCVAVGCANLVRFWLAVRGPGNSARKLVTSDIAAGEWKW